MEVSAEPRFTRRDYAQLPEGFPAELIEGRLVREPSPTTWHQLVVLRLASRLVGALGDDGRVLVAPVDVPIDEWSVLQPDVVVLAPEDRARPDRPRPLGPPVLVAEVLSPTTARRDREVKAALYLRAGVAEVWLVEPATGEIEVRTREDGAVRRCAAHETATSGAVPGFAIRGSDLVAVSR